MHVWENEDAWKYVYCETEKLWKCVYATERVLKAKGNTEEVFLDFYEHILENIFQL